MDDLLGNVFPAPESIERERAQDGLLFEIIIDLSTNYSSLLGEIENSIRVRSSIDQKFLYLHPVAAHKWRNLIRCQQYRIYNQCCQALTQFLQSDTWKNKINAGLNTIVNLGVGLGQKDNFILRNFLDYTQGKRPVTCAMLDISLPMLEATISGLQADIAQHENVLKVVAIRTDFLNLRFSSSYYLRQDSNTAYFILGCTFCNVNERDMMASLRAVIKSGDLLVIGLELYDSNDSEKSLNRMREFYDNDPLRELALIPLKMAGHLNADRDPSTQISVDIADGLQHSSIKGARTILINASLSDDREVLLGSSNRYSRDHVINYVRDFGFEWVDSHKSTDNEFYQHLVFEFRDEGQAQ